mgnify:CR=1 FL=1
MHKVKCGMAISIDGFTAGVDPSFERPFGDMPQNYLTKWMFDEPEEHMKEMEALVNAGAYIMGHKMFAPPEKKNDLNWKGWWGNEPPYHGPVFVLTHTERETITMEGGTSFHFITDGIETAMSLAKEAAGDKDVSIAGGAETVNQFLTAGLIDELWLHVVLVTVGSGARLFLNVPRLAMKIVQVRGTDLVTHIKYEISKK